MGGWAGGVWACVGGDCVWVRMGRWLGRERSAGRSKSTRMLRTTDAKLVLILAHWSCPLAHLRDNRASTQSCGVVPCGSDDGRCLPQSGEAPLTCEKGKRASCIPAAT